MRKNLSIHGLRGLCALMVFVGHVISMSINGGFLTINEYPTLVLAEIGVDIFFVISGYLIVQSLVRQGNVRKFILNRIIRIYPVFLPLLMVMFVVGPLIGFEWMADLNPLQFVLAFLASLFMLPGVFPLEEAVRNSRTLSFEFAFYLVSALTFFSFRKARMFTKYALLLLAIGVSIAVCIRYPRALFFLAGTIVYFLDARIKAWNVSGKLPSIYSLAALLGVYFATYYHQLLIALVFGVAFFAMMAKQHGLLSRFLHTKTMQFYGTISYSFYLLHPFALFPFQKMLGKLPVPDAVNVAIMYALGLVIATAISWASYTLIEVKLTNRLLKKKTNPPILPVEQKPATI